MPSLTCFHSAGQYWLQYESDQTPDTRPVKAATADFLIAVSQIVHIGVNENDHAIIWTTQSKDPQKLAIGCSVGHVKTVLQNAPAQPAGQTALVSAPTLAITTVGAVDIDLDDSDTLIVSIDDGDTLSL